MFSPKGLAGNRCFLARGASQTSPQRLLLNKYSTSTTPAPLTKHHWLAVNGMANIFKPQRLRISVWVLTFISLLAGMTGAIVNEHRSATFVERFHFTAIILLAGPIWPLVFLTFALGYAIRRFEGRVQYLWFILAMALYFAAWNLGSFLVHATNF